MATTFNKRLFGTDLDPEIKNKLRARQILAKHSVLPTDSSDFVEIDGQSYNIKDLMGDVNFAFKNEKLSLGEMSSRTPFARLWTAVELYHSTPEYVGDDYGIIQWDKRFTGKGTNTEWYISDFGEHDYQEAVDESLEKRVYIVNNHHLNQFQSNKWARTTDSIMAGTDANMDWRVSGAYPWQFFPNEGKDNKFMKPPAGITSISSKTEGTMGAIKRTTVSFKVYNFNDFEKIYSRYFLRPGALVFIDFGWDTAKLYDPEDLIKSHHEGTANIYEFLYGNVDNETKGIVEKSKGDLEVLCGRVVNWDAKALRDGGFDCSIEVVSENDAILDHEVSHDNKLKQKFVAGLAPLVINQGARLMGKNFLRTDWMASPGSLEESTAYAMKYAKFAFGTSGVDDDGNPIQFENRIQINSVARKVGIYFQNTFTAKEGDITAESDANTTVDFMYDGGEVGQTDYLKLDPNLHEIQNIYISWGFFEDEILNKSLSLGHGQKYELAGKFDSSQSFVPRNSELVNRQNINSFNTKDKRSLKWLYPGGGTYTSYNTIHDRKPDYKDQEKNYPGKSGFQIDDSLKRVPFREMFVNLKIIQDAFDNVNNVNEAIKIILKELNSFSYDIFDLQLASLSRDGQTLSVVDRNQIEPDKQTGDFYDELFMFKPHDPETIVKDFDINFTTPKNGLQNMIAIGNTGYNNPIYPMTPDEELNNALRNIMKEGKSIGTRSYPVINETNFLGQNAIYSQTSGFEDHQKDLLGGKVDSSQIKAQYSTLATTVDSFVATGDIQEAYKGLDDYDYDMDEIWGKPFYAKGGVGLEDKDGVERVAEKPNEDMPTIDYMKNGALVARNLEEYWGYKAKTQYLMSGLSSILPIDLSLSIYGISGLAPGDLFRVDWMPKRYRETVYFQVTGINQELSSTTWTTKVDCVMRIRLDKKDADLYLQPRQILLSNNFFIDMGMPAQFSYMLTNINPTQYSGAPAMFVGCTARGASGMGHPDRNTTWDPGDRIVFNTGGIAGSDAYQQWEQGTLTNSFIQSWIDDANEKKGAGGTYDWLVSLGWKWNNNGTWELPVKQGNHYYVIICLQGALAFDITEAQKYYRQFGDNPPSNKSIFNYVAGHWKKSTAQWKKDYIAGKDQYVGGGFMTPNN